MLTKADFQRLKSLREKKIREASGLFVIEGEKVVAELIASATDLVEIYALETWSAPAPLPDGRLHRISESEMARISHFPTPSSVLAVGRIQRAALQPGELLRGLTLALDGVQDAGNVGTLLRIADWFGFARVLLSPDCADLYSQKVINASMGSFSRMRVITTALASTLREHAGQTPVLACDLAGESVYQLPALADAIVVIGSEGRGLSPEVRALATRLVHIPRHGGAESLNAGVAAGIVCAQLRRPAL